MNDKEFKIVSDITKILSNMTKEMEIVVDKLEELTDEQVKQRIEIERKISENMKSKEVNEQ